MHEPHQTEAPTPAGATRLPTVLTTSVIRSAYQGQSHGGVYLVDLATGDRTLVLDWSEAGIDWSGRGGDRGLRGIAYWDGKVVLAASDEVFLYTPSFERVASFTNPYLRHCHEIDLHGDRLYLTSCGFDAVLRLDLGTGSFDEGYCLRPRAAARTAYRAAGRLAPPVRRRLLPRPVLRVFDPTRPGGPGEADTIHLNSVRAVDGRVFACGRVLDRLYEITGDRLVPFATVPLRTHNAQPFADGVLLNDTDGDRVLFTDRDGGVRRAFAVPRYDETLLEHRELAGGDARQAFGRGLAVWEERYVIVGSSPATVTVHDLGSGETIASVNLTMDVRNAVHGLEVWPYGT